jgi:hypothetical protein
LRRCLRNTLVSERFYIVKKNEITCILKEKARNERSQYLFGGWQL